MAKLQSISEKQISEKIIFENPWWETNSIDRYYGNFKPRKYFDLFEPLVTQSPVKRATVLMGPRRVGKTVMLFHLIQKLINDGVNPKKICYLSIDSPIYTGLALERLFSLARKALTDDGIEGFYIIFDEIQYLKDWELHLKTLVDSYHHCKFIASGSAAAALKLKSNESGAGRFTDFILPPLTFFEYLDLNGLDSILYADDKEWFGINRTFYKTNDLKKLNEHFLNYINYGGYPELSLSVNAQSNAGQYIKSDIIDKVLLRDLPSLYGIQDVQELNSLFTTIAYNTGNEFTYEGLSKESGVAKNTIKKYITYLEAAFLIKVIYRIDINAKKFTRANYFKIYLTNPSLRAALFAPIHEDDPFCGNMVETAIFSQWWHHSDFTPHYARWDKGEVDIVGLSPTKQKPSWAVEIKWSNRQANGLDMLHTLKSFCQKNKINKTIVTTYDIEKITVDDFLTYDFWPCATYCYTVGRNAIDDKLNEY